ncbi:MAG TPA: hypothetical protein VGB17_08720 [Pyrinomonadaceae bacterium]
MKTASTKGAGEDSVMRDEAGAGHWLEGRIWQWLAIVCLVLASASLWLNHLSTAFVIATLGVVCWFVRYRNQLKSKIITPESEEEIEKDEMRDANED